MLYTNNVVKSSRASGKNKKNNLISAMPTLNVYLSRHRDFIRIPSIFSLLYPIYSKVIKHRWCNKSDNCRLNPTA